MKHKVVGYGSLISHKSLKKTIPDRQLTSVIVKGYRRIFNLAIKKDENPNVLNIERLDDSTFNGVLFEVNDEELVDIKEREWEYNLEEAWVYDFVTGKRLCKCFIVIDYVIAIDKNHRKPQKEYFILCREAAYHISEEFGKYWDNTTYTSDGEKISEWLKKNNEYDTLERSR
ncbi:gamma-glutamylcyclotransferase family protein [Thermoproteota archaeon]